MRGTLQTRVFIAILLGLLTSIVPVRAQDTKPDSKPVAPAKAEAPINGGYRLQEYDDVAVPLQPLVPRSAAIQSRIDALSWYMVGRLFDQEHRNDETRALEAFRKAVKLDPEAVQIYRELVPLEFAAKNEDAGIRLALKHIQLDPEDHDSLQRLAIFAAKQGSLAESIKFFERAINSQRIDKESPEFVELNSLLGQLYSTTGQKDSAADCYQVLFDALKNPDKYKIDRRIKNDYLRNPRTTYEQIGQVLLEANRLNLALEAFESAGKTGKLGEGNLNFNRAKILYLTEKYDEALVELQKYIDSQRISKGRLPYQLLADILAKLNRSDELIQRLETMVENDPQNPSLQYFFADRLAEVNELERARTIYTTMLRSGGDASGYVGLARVLRKMKKPAELLEALGRSLKREDAGDMLQPELKAIKDDKPLMDSLFEVAKERAQTEQLKFEEAFILATLAADLKDADASGEFYRLAISLYRGDNENLTLQLQMDMAEMYVRCKKFDLGAKAYNELLSGNRLNFRAQLNILLKLALAYTNGSQIDEALGVVDRALDLTEEKGAVKEKAGFRELEAMIYTQARRWDEAIQKWDQLIRDFPDDLDLVRKGQFSLSNVYVQKGDLRKGEEILEKVLEVEPENHHANNDLGYLWADQGKNLENAEKMIRKALASDPENAAYLDSLGWVLFKLGKYEEAVPPLEQATQKGTPGDSTLWDHLGDVLLKLMRVEKAVEAWQTGLKHLEDEPTPDAQLRDRMKDKVKQYESKTELKPAEKGTP
jgi:tetratricopeptide (TPR) repeat protein